MFYIPLRQNPERLIVALSHNQQTPLSAVCDIMDNAVTAKAKRVVVKIVRLSEVRGDDRKDNVREYLVIDDGGGMDEAGIKNALALGASEIGYAADTLSKFGLGLKSASFSQGESLELISSPGGGAEFQGYRVSLPQVRAQGQYGAERLTLSEADHALIAEYLPDGHGTIVRIADIRHNNHPAISKTVDELRERVGIIYYYFMRDDGFEIEIDGEICQPLDPLFTTEADKNGNLDENVWDGLTTRWIKRSESITLDAERNIKATLEVTQLPHPPSFKYEDRGKPDAIGKQYRIFAGNYGFYVYRNKRLLGWVERFQTANGPIIPMRQDYFAFRGRINLGMDADDVINLDVKKSQIMLSEDAQKSLSDETLQHKRKSEKAWQFRSSENRERDIANRSDTSNELANATETPEDLPGEPETDAALAEQKKRAEELIRQQKEEFDALAVRLGKSENPEAVEELVHGESAKQSDRVFRVDYVAENALFEPYYDADKKECVRINRTHRLAQVIYQDNSRNDALQILFELILLKFAAAEYYAVRQLQKYDSAQVRKIIAEYRRITSEFLAQMCRDLEEELPRDE